MTDKSKADLVITLQGGSSTPLCEVAHRIAEALTDEGMNVLVEHPSPKKDVWEYGWDGLLMDESVLIRMAGAMRQQDVIKALVEGWAKDHHERGGDFGSFVTLLQGMLGDLGEQGAEGKVTALYNYLGVWALHAVKPWKDEPLDAEMQAVIEHLLD